MNNFLNDDLEPELDMGIFDEEDEDAEPAAEVAPESAVEESVDEVETPPETTLIDHGDMVVDTETGEVIDSGPEAGLPAEPAEEEEIREPAKISDDELDDLFGLEDGTGLDPEDPDNALEVEHISLEDLHEQVAIADEVIDEIIEEERLQSTPEPLPERTKSHIEQAISLMEFKHIKNLDPRAVKFEDCDFGQFEKEIKDAQAIVDGYYTRVFDVNPVDAEYDLGKLSALMVRISGAVGYFQGLAEMHEDQRKFARSAIYTELKELKDEHSLRISDKDADNTSRTMSGKYMVDKAKSVVLAKMITNFWFAMRRFIDVLEGIIIRGRSEAPLEKHAEAAARRPDPEDKMEEIPDTKADGDPVEGTYELGF